MPLELRRQPEPRAVLRGVLQPTDRLAFTMCNPPFYASAEEASAAAARKWRGLGKGARKDASRSDGLRLRARPLGFLELGLEVLDLRGRGHRIGRPAAGRTSTTAATPRRVPG